jgi:hypothetical protein
MMGELCSFIIKSKEEGSFIYTYIYIYTCKNEKQNDVCLEARSGRLLSFIP